MNDVPRAYIAQGMDYAQGMDPAQGAEYRDGVLHGGAHAAAEQCSQMHRAAQGVLIGAGAGEINFTPRNDPWANRSAGMRCRTCVHFVAKVAVGHVATQRVLGRCRRHAPTMSGFPAVYTDDWCGDHKLDERHA